jgi:hypothetical protein
MAAIAADFDRGRIDATQLKLANAQVSSEVMSMFEQRTAMRTQAAAAMMQAGAEVEDGRCSGLGGGKPNLISVSSTDPQGHGRQRSPHAQSSERRRSMSRMRHHLQDHEAAYQPRSLNLLLFCRDRSG